MNQAYYFDADVIIAYFDEDDKEKNRVSKNTVGRAKNNVRMNPSIKVKIPSIAMAEIFLWLLEKSKLGDLSYKVLKVMTELKADFPSPKKEHYLEAVYLLEKDSYLQPHDSLIVAHALLDGTTTHLLTFDRNLTTNREITNRMIELGNRFKIGSEL